MVSSQFFIRVSEEGAEQKLQEGESRAVRFLLRLYRTVTAVLLAAAPQDPPTSRTMPVARGIT